MDTSKRDGVIYAILAYTLWGFLVLYFKKLESVPSGELLMHRIIWSFAFTLVLIVFLGGVGRVIAIAQNKRHMTYLFLATLFLAANWLIFIWSVKSNRVLDASLGYYINPLVNVVLGLIVFGERLRTWQWAAVSLAGIGVLNAIFNYGQLPWIAISLALCFGIYGMLRKKITVDSQTGLLLETSLLLLPAFLYLTFFTEQSQTSNLLNNSWQLNFWLILAGPVTSVPLLFFNAAAQRLNYGTLGLFQYIAPSILFLMAIVAFGEAFTLAKGLTFVFIWSALVIYSIDSLLHQRRMRQSDQTEIL